MITLKDFRKSLREDTPPANLSPGLEALWYAANDEWDKAHDLVQDAETGDGAWVHAHLHRIEGDTGNAAYWYRRAGRPVATGDLQHEWDAMVETLLRDTTM